jgi:opacity protein-like surface antigen
MLIRVFILSGAIILGFTAQNAAAQERWSGAYGGLSLSLNATDSSVKRSAAHRYESDVISLGFHGGYNFAKQNGFVWGADILLTGLDASGRRTDAALGSSKSKGSFLLSPRVRVGYATEKVFFYGLLGLGLSDVGIKASGSGGTDLVLGGAIGVGMEFATSDKWSIRVEAVSYDLGISGRTINGVRTSQNNNIQQLSIGLSRKF